MIQEKELKRHEEIKELASSFGLDFYETFFEEVPQEIMAEFAAYCLPIRAHHWSYGKVYDHLRIYGKMGYSKIYEMVINNNPAYAFLLDTNTDVANLLVVGHVYAHVDFFKNNIYFQEISRNMVNEAADHAEIIRKLGEKYGEGEVEKIMDIGFALDRHIDFRKGLERELYPKKQVIEEELKDHDYADIFGDKKPGKTKKIIGDKLPPYPEKDILFFLINYADIEDWEKKILEIVRKESFYFYPLVMTKIINEGWASYWHAEIGIHYWNMTEGEHLAYEKMHSDVVNPGDPKRNPFVINPYYLGYKILQDIEKRWDKYYAKGKSDINGKQKLFEVRTTENSFSLILDYLTQELVNEMNLFTYNYAEGHAYKSAPRDIEVKSTNVDDVIESLNFPLYNYGVPLIKIVDAQKGKNGALMLVQDSAGVGGVDENYAKEVMKYMHHCWKGPIELESVNCDSRKEPYVLVYDGKSFIKKGKR